MNVVPIGPVLGLIVNDAFGGRFAAVGGERTSLPRP